MNTDCIFCTIGSDPFPEEFRTWSINQSVLALIPRPCVQRGHVLIIPKEHFGSLPEIPEDLIKELFLQAIAMGERMKKVLGAQAYYIRVNNEIYLLEKSSSLHVGHIHIHVVPRYHENDDLTHEGPTLTEKECEDLKSLLMA